MNRFSLILLTGSMLFGSVLSSCNNNEPIQKNDPAPMPDKEKPATEPTPWERLDLTKSQQETNEATSKYASHLLSTCLDYENMKNGEKNNIFISPLGLSNILTMLGNGASEDVLKEITNVLGANLDQLNSFYSLIAEWLPKADNQVTFSTANSIWIQNAFTPSESYLNLMRSNFMADVFNRDLSSNETKEEINLWCSEKTDRMILEFLKEPLDPLCVMFLANALYFNGKWTEPIKAEENTFEKFHSVISGTKEIEMMHGNKGISYERKIGGELVSIQYGNATYSFNIFLPSEGVSLKEALDTGKWLGKASSGTCFLTFPKFNLSYRNEDFKNLCEAMGIRQLFQEDALPQIANDLMCNKILQEARLEVNESGAKAAAVTGAALDVAFSGEKPTEPANVVVNRPFIFSITASNHDILLFTGIVRNL